MLIPAVNSLFGESHTQIRINAGGSRYIDRVGNTWLRDHIFTASRGYGYLGISGKYETTSHISNTNDPRLYQSECHKLYGYKVTVPNGHYSVILHFAEIYHTKKSRRVMDIKLEGQLVHENLDIVAAAGANSALVLTFSTAEMNTPVTDGSIDVELIRKKDETKLSAIEVIQLEEQPVMLNVEPETLDFGSDKSDIIAKIDNIGTLATSWRLSADAQDSWVSGISPAEGTLPAGESETVTVHVTRDGLQSGQHHSGLILSAENVHRRLPVHMVVSGEAKLYALSPVIDFGEDARNMTCVLINQGGSPLKWAIGKQRFPAILKRIYPFHGVLEVGEEAYLNVSIDRSKISPGEYSAPLMISSGSGPLTLSLKARKVAPKFRILYVDVDADGLENGSSWKNAFRSLKSAIAHAGRAGGRIVEIWVAQGMYYENDILVPSGVHLYGGFRGDETQREERNRIYSYPTIIDAQRRGRCFECEHNVVIDGFIIQNGRDWGSGDGKGAAVLAYDNDVKIRNNIIRNNVDSWAGALFIEGFEQSKKVSGSSPLIEHNIFYDNFSNYCAAAIEVRGTEAVVRNNTIARNQGFGLEIQDLLGPFDKIVYGDFYHNVVTENYRKVQNDVWAEARKVTNYSFVGSKWSTSIGRFKPYDLGTGNIFGDDIGADAGFISMRNDNFRLKSDSPCIDAGDPAKGTDYDGSPPDLGAIPFNRDKTELDVSPMRIDFGSESRRRTITLSAYGGKSAQWRAEILSVAGDVLRIEPASGELSNGERAVINLSLDRTGLKDKAYDGYIAFMTNEESCEAEFAFISNNSLPEITPEPPSIHFVAELSGEQTGTRRIQVNNAIIGDMHWTASTKWGRDWLRISPADGSDSDFLTLDFSATSLPRGDYREEILLNAENGVNNPLIVPVLLTVKAGQYIAEIQAENSITGANSGWAVVQNDGERAVQALMDSREQPQDAYRLDYEFTVPDGVDHVYIFAEIDVNGSPSNDSFWTMVNGYDPCDWNYVNTKHEGWSRSWVYNTGRDQQHMYVVTPGKNTLSLFSREKGAYVNWFVVTNDPDINIKTYGFGKQ
jgi:hypothetical protein